MSSLSISGGPDLSSGGGGSVAPGGTIIPPAPGGPSGATTGGSLMPLSAPVMLWTPDADVPDGIDYLGPYLVQTSAPTDSRFLWFDNSVAAPYPLKAYIAGAWTVVPTKGDPGNAGPPGAGTQSLLTANLTAGAVGAGGITASVAQIGMFGVGLFVVILDTAGGVAYYQVTGTAAGSGGAGTATLTRLNWDTSAASTYSFTTANGAFLSLTGRPGPKGDDGPISTIRATTTSAAFVSGAFGAGQAITVAAPSYFQVGDYCAITDGTVFYYGKVSAVGTSTITVTRYNVSADPAQAGTAYTFASGSTCTWTGAPGAAGNPGAVGSVKSATTAAVSAGAIGASVTVSVSSTAPFTTGGVVALTDSTGARADYAVTAIGSATVTGVRLATGAASPPSAGYSFASGSTLSISGAPGQTGLPGSGSGDGAGLTVTPVTINGSPYTITSTTGGIYDITLVSAPPHDQGVILPDPSTCAGYAYVFQRADLTSGTAFVNTNGAGFIGDVGTDYPLTRGYDTLTIISDGTNWIIQAHDTDDGYLAVDKNLSDVANTNTARTNLGAEASLGNPSADGYLLSSLADGTRSWVAPGGGATALQMAVDLFSPDGTQTTFTLANAIAAGTIVLVYQVPQGLKYPQSQIVSATGNSVVFHIAPAAGSNSLEIISWH